MEIRPGQTAFITGGAGGIGSAIALAFGRRGLNVMIADVEREALDVAVDALRHCGVKAHGLLLDVINREAVVDAARLTAEQFGKVHILCNNAGVIVSGGVADLRESDWDWIIDVNVKGIINGMEAFLPHLKEHGEGAHVVNTASVAGLLSSPEYEPYHGTKHAVIGLSEGWSAQLSKWGIGLSILCPGLVPSKILSSSRNRAPTYGPARGLITPAGAADSSAAVPAAAVAERVIEGIKADELYLFTHEEYEPLVDQRFATILSAFKEAPASATAANLNKSFRVVTGAAVRHDDTKYLGRNALVIGGAKGIGLSLARHLAKRGMNLTLADDDPNALGTAIKDLQAESISVQACHVDLRSRASVEVAAHSAIRAFGNIHWLCNAAHVVTSGEMDAIAPQTWTRVFDINMKAVINAVSVVLPLIEAHGEGGHILNVGSLNCIVSAPTYEPFTATQYALLGMSEGWAHQLRPRGITVSLLCPEYKNMSYILPSEPIDPSAILRTDQDDEYKCANISVERIVEFALDQIEETSLYLCPDSEARHIVEARHLVLKAAFSAARASPALRTLPKRTLPIM